MSLPPPDRNRAETCRRLVRLGDGLSSECAKRRAYMFPLTLSFYGAKRRAQMSSPNIAGWYARLCMANLRLTYEQDAIAN